MKVTHEVRGEGETVYLVAGLGQVGERWHRVAKLLAEDHRVVTLDNRETGGTGACTDGFLLADLAADVLELATDLGDDRFFLAGISMGGMISQEILAAAPERIRAAALLATHDGTARSVPPTINLFDRGSEPIAEGEARIDQAGRFWASLAGADFVAANPEIVRAEGELGIRAGTAPEGYLRQMMAIQQYDMADRLVGTEVPVIVLHGNADPLVPYPNGEALAARLGVELVTFDGSGHWLEVERAPEVADLLRTHFAKAAAQGR